MSKKKNNSVRRSIARGSGARGVDSLPDVGREAYDKSLKSTKGTYKIEFVTRHDKATDRDVELRKVYGKSLVSGSIGIPEDMIQMKIKKESGEQTLTALDEVFYIYVGKQVYGKLSIRTQRRLRDTEIIFIYQAKKRAPKPPVKSFSQNRGYSKRTRSQISRSKRSSYNKRRGGRY